jgi:MFS transporter, ACS family, D-galactonate transporter
MTATSTEARLPRLRWLIAALLSVGVLINYFDRIALSVAAPELQVKFGLSPAQLGVLFSAFFWSYALLQIPAGVWLDRFGVTRLGRVSALCWGLASLMTAAASGFAGILVARITLGIAEAPSFPANSKATGHWFPRGERARATALFDAAAKFSNVVGVPLIALIIVRCGWRWGFALVAALSFGYAWAFWRHYREPRAHLQLTSIERDYIVRGGATTEDVFAASSAGMLRYLLRNRKIWGLSLGFAAYGYCFYFFLTWLPSYLVQSLHMDTLRSAGLAAIPWACATAADLLIGGWLIDALIARGLDESRVRKSVLLTGMCAGLAVFGATVATDPYVAIVWISVAMAGLSAAAPVGWSLPSLLAPTGGVGTVGALMNFANNIAGGLAPAVTGYAIGRTGSFNVAFLIAGLVLLCGVAAFTFLLGRIEKLPDP